MFDKLFRSRAVVQRHLSSPLLQERLEYLQHCANQGYSLTTLRELAADRLLIQNLLGLATSSDSHTTRPISKPSVRSILTFFGYASSDFSRYFAGYSYFVAVIGRAGCLSFGSGTTLS